MPTKDYRYEKPWWARKGQRVRLFGHPDSITMTISECLRRQARCVWLTLTEHEGDFNYTLLFPVDDNNNPMTKGNNENE